MKNKCPICNTLITNVDAQYCKECGWELVVSSDSASEQLKSILNEKQLIYEQHYSRLKKTEDENVKLNGEIKEVREELAKMKVKEPSSLSSGRRLCAVTDKEIIVLKIPGEHTFGRVGPDTETHFTINDRGMDSKHFALQVRYNLPDGSIFSCNIKSIGNKDTVVNGTRKIGARWENIDANDVIEAGDTKITLVLTK